jgi:hypothetical protein
MSLHACGCLVSILGKGMYVQWFNIKIHEPEKLSKVSFSKKQNQRELGHEHGPERNSG